MPEDGEPMSEFTLGERYSSEDMYRDMGVERPELPDVPWVDSIASVTFEIGPAVMPVDPIPPTGLHIADSGEK